MSRKLRIRFVLITMITLCVMQLGILIYNAFERYRNIIHKSEKIVDEIVAAKDKEALSKIDARFFIVTFSSSKDNIKINLDYCPNVRRNAAMDMAKQTLASGKTKGFYNNYWFSVVKGKGQKSVVMVSRTMVIDYFKSSVKSGFMTSAIVLTIMLVIVLIASWWVVKPFVVNNQKQKEFITSASHELKTPLTIINADAEILEMDYEDNEWVKDIIAQTHKLKDMTQNLVFLARLDEQGNKIRNTQFDMSSMVFDAVSSYESVSKTDNKLLNIDVQKEIHFLGDESGISQLVNILMDNAFKYCPEGGEITFKMYKSGNKVYLGTINTVADVNDESLDRLFDRFYRNSALSSSVEGHGLGLSIAKAIVSQHKGTIKATYVDDDKIQILAVFKLTKK